MEKTDIKKKDIKKMTFEELQQDMELWGEKQFRVKQIYEWMHKKLAQDFSKMSNLSIALREKLDENYEYTTLKLIEEQTSKQDGTKKFLFLLPDDNLVESVLMRYRHGNSVCISSQVGCRMGCGFCASTLGGLTRNLASSEMLEQIYMISRLIGERVSNVVVMGTGEPLDNYENLIRFIHLLSDERGLNISQRNITVSTCGIVPEIYRLGDELLQITLAISLHAADDDKRQQIMPIAKSYTIDETLKACKYYFNKTGRRITFEYSLIEGFNDSEEDAETLIHLLKPFNCHVNLIPVNPIKERDYKQSSKDHIQRFKNKLEKNGINGTIRREMGRDIDGACGQLRQRHKEQAILEV